MKFAEKVDQTGDMRGISGGQNNGCQSAPLGVNMKLVDVEQVATVLREDAVICCYDIFDLLVFLVRLNLFRGDCTRERQYAVFQRDRPCRRSRYR